MSALLGGSAVMSAPISMLSSAETARITERPLPADLLADSIGVNTDVVHYYQNADFKTLTNELKTLGLRHVRDGINAYAPYEQAMTQWLSISGAKIDGITDCSGIAYYPTSPTSPADIQQFNVAIGNRLEAIESPNEVDNRKDPAWAADTNACLRSLRGSMPSLPFLAPSLANYSSAPQLGDLSAKVDLGNMHRYFGGHNPGTKGWGSTGTCGTYGALDWAKCKIAVNSTTKPIFVTETGYNSQREVDEATQAKYLSRVFFVNLRAKIPRSYVYMFKDTGGGTFGSDGLLRSNDSPKPAYYAIGNEVAYFSDQGPAVPTIPLTYSISTNGISHLLLQKRDGTYIMALWNETSSWDLISKRELLVSPKLVLINVPINVHVLRASSLTDSGNIVAKPVSIAGSVIKLAVDDHMTFVSFK